MLQWYGLFGGALAWATMHVVGYFLSAGRCNGNVHPNLVLWESVLAAVALGGVLAAEAASVAVYRATASAGKDAPGPDGRLHFFAQAALLGNVLFFVLVVFDTVGVLYHSNCGLS